MCVRVRVDERLMESCSQETSVVTKTTRKRFSGLESSALLFRFGLGFGFGFGHTETKRQKESEIDS